MNKNIIYLMKVKKQLISIIYAFIILISYSLSNKCEIIGIRKRYFNLRGIKEDGDDKADSIEINGVKYEAFSYIFFDHYEFQLKKDLIDCYINALKAEGSKIHLYGLLTLANKAFSSIGQSFSLNSNNYIRFLDNVKKEVINDFDLDDQNKVKILEEINFAQTNLTEYSNRYINNVYADTAGTFTSLGIGFLAGHLIKEAFSLSNPVFNIISTSISLLSGYGIIKWWNGSSEEEIKKNQQNYDKYRYLLEDIFERIKRLEWMNNNIIYTGISLIPDCKQIRVKFDYEDGIKYRNQKNINYNMARRSCNLGNCKNLNQCIQDIKKVIKCNDENGNGGMTDCPRFDIYSCSLEYDDL